MPWVTGILWVLTILTSENRSSVHWVFSRSLVDSVVTIAIFSTVDVPSLSCQQKTKNCLYFKGKNQNNACFWLCAKLGNLLSRQSTDRCLLWQQLYFSVCRNQQVFQNDRGIIQSCFISPRTNCCGLVVKLNTYRVTLLRHNVIRWPKAMSLLMSRCTRTRAVLTRPSAHTINYGRDGGYYIIFPRLVMSGNSIVQGH